jgi:type I restriction enzyme R subunit
MNEADTCRTYILPKLQAAGWEDETISEQMVLTPGRIVPIGDRLTRSAGGDASRLRPFREAGRTLLPSAEAATIGRSV